MAARLAATPPSQQGTTSHADPRPNRYTDWLRNNLERQRRRAAGHILLRTELVDDVPLRIRAIRRLRVAHQNERHKTVRIAIEKIEQVGERRRIEADRAAIH